jgi:hypothetical protein
MSASSGLGPLSAGADLPDLGMHRASVDRAFDHRLGFARLKILLRIGEELGFAAVAAEIISLTLVVGARLVAIRIDRHAADRVDRTRCRQFGRARRKIFLRIGEELGAAAVAAEIISLALVFGVRLAGVGVDGHAADRVNDAADGGGAVTMVLVVGGRAHGGPLRLIPLGGI